MGAFEACVHQETLAVNDLAEQTGTFSTAAGGFTSKMRYIVKKIRFTL